jgi:Tfp pilus assembly protein PilO
MSHKEIKKKKTHGNNPINWEEALKMWICMLAGVAGILIIGIVVIIMVYEFL